MLRHEFSCYDAQVQRYATESLYNQVMDDIARDFPWLAAQVAYDKSIHASRLPDNLRARRWAHQDGVAKQRAGRSAARTMTVGDHVTVSWRGARAHGVLTEVRRSRVKVKLTESGRDEGRVIDRPADEIAK